VLVHKDDLTSTPGELLDHDDLIGRAAGQAGRSGDPNDCKRPCRRQIASTIQGGPIEAGATHPVIDEHTARGDVIAGRFGGLQEEVYLAGDGFFAFLLIGGYPSLKGGTLPEPLIRRVGRISRWGTEFRTVDGCGCRCACRHRSMACHTRAFPFRQGTLTPRISSARGGPSDTRGLPPVRVLVLCQSRCFSLAERRQVGTHTCGSWAGGHDGPRGGGSRQTSGVFGL
jgi:hypothetical protein